MTIALAYRQVAKDKGWLVPWSEKLKGNPDRAKLFGAINYKLWSTLSRRLSEDSKQEISVRVNWTFDEAAQVAEHLKRDLKLDKVLFMIGGWIRRGYDIQQSADYVLHHIGIGRTLNYHSVPAHLYWKEWKEPVAGETKTAPDAGVFVRATNGWAEGLHPMDRFVKNTSEILSPLNELTSQTPMTRHEFLTPNRAVQRSVFGQDADRIEVITNAGSDNYSHRSPLGGEVLLPPHGFVIEGPTFAAFHARKWNGIDYDAPVLFTLRSLDGKPLKSSGKIRVYHAFGDPQIKLGEAIRTVAREDVL